MFKKLSIGVLVVTVLALGVVGTVFAQGPQPPVDGVCPYGGACGGYARGGFGYRGAMPTILSDALGMTVEELQAALADGQTIAELADAQGVKMDDLVEALIAPRVERLEQAVADGYLTQEQADGMIEQMKEHMTARLENGGLGYGGYQGSGCGMMGGGLRGGRGGGWRGGRWGGNSYAPPSNDL